MSKKRTCDYGARSGIIIAIITFAILIGNTNKKIETIENINCGNIDSTDVREDFNAENNLLPCPFCGSKAVLSVNTTYKNEAQITCNECGVYVSTDFMDDFDTIEEAKEDVIIKWDTRIN